MKRLLVPLLVLALLAGCAGAPAAEPAEVWVPDETPEAREARILATAEPLAHTGSNELPAEDSSYEDWLRCLQFLLLTARDPDLTDTFGGAFADVDGGRLVLYATEPIWKPWLQLVGWQSRTYFLDEMDTSVPLDLAICDFSLAELGRTARELEALLAAPEGALTAIRDVRVEPAQNRVAVYAEEWDAGKQAELEKALAHPEHCAVTLDAPPDGSALRFVDGGSWDDTGAALADEAALQDAALRAAEQIYNAWWYLPAGSWQRQLTDLDPTGGYARSLTFIPTWARHLSLFHRWTDDGQFTLLVNVTPYDGQYTPLWDEWGEEQEAFLRDLLAGLPVGIYVLDKEAVQR